MDHRRAAPCRAREKGPVVDTSHNPHTAQRRSVQHNVLAFNVRGDHAPVIFLAEAHLDEAAAAVSRLLRGRPVLSLLGKSVRGAAQPRIETIAEDMLRKLRALLPTGPFHLVGHGRGGLVAYEMAVQLRAAGREPTTLVLIDCAAPGYPAPLSWTERAFMHGRILSLLPLTEGITYAYDQAREALERRAHTASKQLGGLRSRATHGREAWRSDHALRQAAACYEPSPLSADVSLICTIEARTLPPSRCTDAELGWRRVVRGSIRTMRMEHVRSTRGELLLDGVPAKMLGRMLRALLDQADRKYRMYQEAARH
jgi:thioesterase domain-containing protein